MSDFGMFEADEATQAQPRLAAKTAGRKLEAAIDAVRQDFGRFLLGATGIDEFEDRWHLSKNDIRAKVEPHVFPNTGTMRRIQNAMKADWKLAHPYKLAEDRDAPIQDLDETYHHSDANLIPEGNFEGYKDSVDQGGPAKVQNAFTPGGDSGSDRHEAARLVADIYADFAQANGLRVASLDTLDHYASIGIADADYRLLESMIIRQAECDEDCDDDEDTEDSEDSEDAEDSEGADSKPPSKSEGDESESDDDEGEDYDFGGESASEGEQDSGGEDYDFGDADGDGDHDDDDHHDGGGDVGQTFTVPEQAPELPPEMMGEIPQDDTDGSAPIPPEVIDSLLGLPEGTIEQLLLEEVTQGAQGGGDPGMSGPPMPLEGAPGMGGAPQGGGEDFFGEDGDDAEQEQQPPRTAHRRRRANIARRFWAAEGEEQQPAEGGAEQAPPQDPAAQQGGGDPAAMGMDPAAMGGGMMPPPGSQSVQPPAPPQPMEDQPAEDALLDTANQAIMQMIDRETQEYQQIIDPLSQALQAIQFAQQVEQTEHPMDVTPPQGTVDVSPSAAAPAGQPPMQQQARRQAKAEFGIRGAARLIAARYKLSGSGERMLLEAMGRRNYEHIREALQLLPPDHLQAPQYRAAVRHIGEMFAAENPRFNHDAWMKSVLGSASRGRLPFDRPRLAGETMVHTPTMDHFEWENDQPVIDDNNPLTDLPPIPGGHIGARAEDAVSRFQRWTKWRQDNGLVVPGGEGGVHTWMQKTKNPAKPKVGPRASGEVHRSVGADPDAVNPGKPKPVKAVNPTLQKKPKAPKAPKAAAFFLDGPGDDDPLADPSRLHCSRCGHSGPGASDDDDIMCPKCPGAVMDYKFYGHGTDVLANQFLNEPESDYGDALFEELKHRAEFDDEHAAKIVQNEVAQHGDRGAGGRGKPDPDDQWADQALDAIRHPSNWEAVPPGEHRPGKPVPHDDYQLPPEADPRQNRSLLSNHDRTGTWGEWEPAKQASFFTRKVPGWRWDDHLSGYLSKEARDFACSCGQKVASPSYKTCSCGKVWNVYAIGDTHHLASDTAEVYIAREIPVRPGVIMANRKMAKGDCDCWDGYCRVPGTKPCAEGSCEKCDSHRKQSRHLAGEGMSYEDTMKHIDDVLAEGEGHSLHHQPGVDDPKLPLSQREYDMHADYNGEYCHDCGGDGVDWDTYPNHEGVAELCGTCDGTGENIVDFEPHFREPRPGSIRAEATWQRHLAEIRRMADWTKYDDDVDPVAETYGKSKIPSTKAPKIPRDWSRREPDGKWKNTNFAPKKK